MSKEKACNLEKNNLSVENCNLPSGRSTPVFSWSPLPVRRKLGCPVEKNVRKTCH